MTLKHRLYGLLYLVLIISLLAGLSACNFGGKEESSQSESEAEEVFDPGYPVIIGEVQIDKRPNRVVSLADSITEKIYDMNLQDSLVGVSEYTVYPTAAQELIRCGTAQIPLLTAIQEAGADVVLTTAPVSEMDAESLEERGILVVVLEQGNTLEGVWKTYEEIALVLEGQEKGKLIAEEATSKAKNYLKELQTAIDMGKNESIPGLYLKKLDFTVATGDSVENELLTLIGIDNVASEYTGWSLPEFEVTEGDGKEKLSAVKAIFIDESDVTIKDLEKNKLYKALPAITDDFYHYVNSPAIERQGFSMLGEVYKMAEFLWEEKELPEWKGTASASSQEEDSSQDTDNEESSDDDSQDE